MTKLYQIDQKSPNEELVSHTAAVLLSGGVAVFPTETVYGIAVSVAAGASLQRIFEIKRRDFAQSIPWLVADAMSLDNYGVDVPDYAYKLAQAYWPGALTLVVRASALVDARFTSADGSIALRAPDSPLVQALIKATAAPLATSSANTHSQASPRSFLELETRIIDEVDIVLDGGVTDIGNASTIVSCMGTHPKILRDCAIPAHEICKIASK